MKKSFMLQVKNAFSISVIMLTLLFALKSESAFAQPSFVNGATQSITICQDSGPNDITSLLAISDVNVGSTETWSIISSTGGSLTGFSYSTSSTGSIVTPVGLNYTPPSGLSGTRVFQIRVSDGTVSDVTTITVTINPLPVVGAISGASSVCVGAFTTLSDATASGTWSTSDATIASVDVSGSVRGVATGSATISYSVTNSCGTTTVTQGMTVNDVPTVLSIGGPGTICVGATTTFSDPTSGGTWSTSDNTIASVNSSTGDVTGVSIGLANISYTVTNSCGTTSQFASVTVSDVPTVPAISGASTVCVGSSISYTDGTSGGSWSTSDATIASVDPTTGNVTGVATGAATITYSVTNTCGTTTVTQGITVIDVPVLAAIGGATTVCVGATASVTDATAGGAWSTDVATIASVDGSGTLYGVAIGTANITYSITNTCGTGTSSTMVTVNDVPTVAAITGSTPICVGAGVTLADATAGGTWGTSDATVASVDGSGNVTGVAIGTATISYSVTNSCGTTTQTTSITVNGLPTVAAISGTSPICVGASTTYTDATSSGSWSTSDATIASIDASTGNVTGMATSSATISYAVTNTCGTTTVTSAITVNDIPVVAAIGGATTVCVGATTTLTDATAGGTWSTDAATTASVDGSGTLYGVAAGTTNITYTVTNACGTGTNNTGVTVNSLPGVAAITGASAVCVGASVSYTDGTSGGAWSSSDATIASVDAGTGSVTGVATGSATISYSVTNSCGTTTVTQGITVNDVPVVPAIGGSTTVCIATTASVTDATTGGTWSTDAATVASVDGSGTLYGVSVGTANITYSVSNTCGAGINSTMVTVNGLPTVAAITGSTPICVGAGVTLADATAGGTWGTSDATVASVDGSGNVTGMGAGSATISYSVTNSCGTTTQTTSITVNGLPTVAAISGTSPICVGASTTYTDATSSGSWSTSDATIASVDAPTGNVTGMATGSATISYAVTNTCGTTTVTSAITVNDVPSVAAIGGATTVCEAATTTLTDATAGGTWSTDAATTASVDGSGTLYGVAAGTTNITYTVTNACGSGFNNTTVTVNPLPATPAAIGGTTTVCRGNNVTLTESVSGGSWSVDNAAISSITGGGGSSTVAFGVSVGTTVVSYTITNGCGSSSASTPITVIDIPVVPAIGGATTVCVGATASVTDATTGGAWTTDVATIASVDGSGTLYGVAIGTANITYSLTNTCGTGTNSTMVTVNDVPTVAAITGSTPICVGAGVTLADATAGGAWGTSDATVASVDGSGNVTGMGAGSSTISYSVTNSCGTTTQTTSITVNGLPTIAAISGTSPICVGASTTYTDATSSGSWSTSDATIASIDASTGNVTGMATGSATISYALTNTCGTTTVTSAITVNDIPVVAAIGGATTVCLGATTTLTDATSGGSWTTDAASTASIDASTGIVTGVAVGTANITYTVTNACGSSSNSTSITVNPLPSAGVVSGAATVCVGVTTTFTDGASGGSWSSDAAGVATVNPSTGDVTGVSTGTANISYSVTNGCGTLSASQSITVNDVPVVAAIGGAASVCEAATTTLTDATSSGSWTTDAATTASIDASTGLVTGVAAGTANITYTVTNSCGSNTATVSMTVNPLPATPAAITGASPICAGASITLANSVSGGTWSSDAASIATVDPSTGNVTGVAAGTANISYTITNSCGSLSATTAMTINDVPVVPAISGAATVCVGATTSFTDATSGGAWSTSAATTASIDASTGTVTGVAVGTANITYSVTNTCGTGSNTTTITVNDVPSVAGITGAAAICPTTTVTLADATTGGSWTTDAPSVASVDASTGIVTGVSAGTANISYTVTNGCGSTSVSTSITVNPAPDAGTISGGSSVCVGATTTLTDGISGGTWSSSAVGVASVSTTGDVTGLTTGSATISYTVTNSCGTIAATQAMTVNDVPVVPAIGGPASVCETATITLTDATSGGTWTTDAATTASVDGSLGTVYGVNAGTANITYAVTNSCGTTSVSTSITVNAAPVPGSITGVSSICVSATTTYTESASTGTWSSDNVAVASISTTGDIFGVSAGTANISYSVTNGCGTLAATQSITINGNPAVAAISGSDSVCAGNTINMTDATSGGTWSITDATVATIDGSGVVTSYFLGFDTVQYTVTGTCGSTMVSFPIYVNDYPATPVITGTSPLCQGATETYTADITGGAWSSSDVTVVTIDPASGLAAGVGGGSATISYVASNTCGSTGNATTLNVTALPAVGPVTGSAHFCNGSTTTYTNSTSGGTWSSSNAGVATIDPSTGFATGLATGTTDIHYAVTGVCGTVDSVLTISIDALADAGTISGASTICMSAPTALSETATGGSWSSSDLTVASVDAVTGTVYAVSIGGATITYTVVNGCGMAFTPYGISTDDVPVVASVTGSNNLCVGATAAFSDITGGGTWSTGNATIASVDVVGNVTGMGVGTTNISYSVTNTCGTVDSFLAVNVNLAPLAGTIVGAPSVCSGSSTTLTDVTSGGVWSSSDMTIASIDPSSGVVGGISAGSVTISYSVTNSCGTANATFTFTVDDIPVVAPISGGATTMCIATPYTLTDATSGGSWSSSDLTLASVDASTGTVTGVGVGLVTISYTVVNGCGPNTATTSLSVDDVPSVAGITGSSSVCSGSSTTLSDITTGGTWSTSDATVASVNVFTGSVRGVAIGSATITYTVTNTCGTSSSTQLVNVITVPAAAPAITGVPAVCVGATTALADATGGGTWSSSNIATATVDIAGLVTGLAASSVNITYSLSNVCGSTPTVLPVTVNDVPTVAAITGASFVCVGSSTTLSDATTTGSWSSSDITVASVDPASGAVTGISGGAVTISYAVTNTCGTTTVSYPFTITPLPVVGPITGTSTACVGSTFLVHNDTTGGIWTTSNGAIASIDASGIITGVAAGTATISYTLTTICGTAMGTLDVTITDVPVIAAITGSTPVCVGYSSLFTDDSTGGTWATSDNTIASIDATGNVTGVAVGGATISYTLTNFCGPNTVTFALAIAPAPVTGTITGATSVCVGSVTTLADAAGFGSWSSSDIGVASVDPATGDVTGVSAGSVTISYAVTNSCGTGFTTYSFTVNDVPTVPGITGVTTVCELSTTSLGDATAGGLWTSSDLTVASVDIAGVVYGVAAGLANISYTVTNVCGNTIVAVPVTVSPLPVASTVTGPTFVCAGATITLSDASAGGSWSSSDVTIASVDPATGVVTGVSAATVTISYSVTNSCGTVDSTYAVNVGDVPIVASITGSSTLCPGTTALQSDATTGGAWSSSNITVASIDAASGLAYGVAVGSASISYAVTNICGVTTISTGISVNPVPFAGPVSGTAVVCVGATTTFSDTSAGGVWSSSSAATATVNASTGVITGVASGVALISYTVTTSCGTSFDTLSVTVNDRPSVAAISGFSAVCIGNSTTLSDATTSGTWSTADATIASVDASGNVSATGAGTVNISYTVSNSCGPTSSLLSFTVHPLPSIGAITGTLSACVSSSSTLADTTAGGTWTTSNATVASINTTGTVYGVAAGSATITYTVTSSFGCVGDITATFTVNPLPVLSAIGGATGVALGSTATVTDTAAGGTWTTSDASVASINSSTGVVYGVAYGTVTITYTKTSSFGCTSSVTTSIGVAGSLSASFIYPRGTTSFCHNTPIPILVYTADTTNHLTYQWFRNGVAISGATDSTYVADSVGYYAATITNAAGSVLLTGVNVVAPPNPVINVTSGHILFTGSFATYQWMLNGVIIPGATTSVHTETAAGFYNVIVTDGYGCMDTSASFVDTTYGVGVGVGIITNQEDLRIYPNPATSVINIEARSNVNVSILSADGKILIRKERVKSVDVSELTGGMYMILVYDENNTLLKADRFVKVE